MKFVFFAPVEQQHAGVTRHFNPGQVYDLQEHEIDGFIRAGLGQHWDGTQDYATESKKTDEAPPLTENQQKQLDSLLSKQKEKPLTQNQAEALAKLQAKAAAHAAASKE